MTLYVGSRPRLRARTYDFDDQPSDPVTLVFRISDPAEGDLVYTYGTDVELIRAGVGDYYIFHTCLNPGRHRFAVTTSLAHRETTFLVRPRTPDA
jgi:hypothetical protein